MHTIFEKYIILILSSQTNIYLDKNTLRRLQKQLNLCNCRRELQILLVLHSS